MVLANDSDPRGHALTVTAVANPPNGTATVSGDRKSITYRPDSGFSGSDAFDYTVSDGRGGTAQGSVVVTVRKGSGPAEPIYVGSDTTPYHDDSCDNETLDGTLYRNAEIGPWLAADPTDANNLIAVWQQDRFSNGGSRGNAGAYSTDGGETWNGFTLPMLTKCTGGPWARATDPWATYSPNGHAYAMSLVFGDSSLSGRPRREAENAIVVQKSTDKGARWRDPITVILDAAPACVTPRAPSPRIPTIPTSSMPYGIG